MSSHSSKDLEQELEDIIASCQSRAWNNLHRQTLRKFREKLGSPREIVHALGISIPTVYAWEKQLPENDQLRPPPSEKQLRKFTRVIAERHFSSTFNDARPEQRPVLYDVLMRTRTAADIMARAAFCSSMWAIRSGRPFLVGVDQKTFEIMVQFMRDNSKTIFYFGFCDLPDFDGTRHGRAKDSYEAFWRKLNALPNSEKLTNRVVPIPIRREDDALRIGLSDPWISFAWAEYSEEGRIEFHRSCDVWMEFIFDISKNPQEERKEPVWLELPPDEAEVWREKRLPILKRNIATNTTRKSCRK